MRCQDFQFHLLKRTQEKPDPVLAASMVEHCSDCLECMELMRLWQELEMIAQPEPPPGMTTRFLLRLGAELASRKQPIPFTRSWWFPISVAAALMLSVAGILGYSLGSSNGRVDPLLASLRVGNAADRMEAIALVSTETPGQGDLVLALMDRISNDPNLKIRLSAVEALYMFNSDPSLSHRIEAALPGQTRPEVQLALIDLLGALRQKRAADALHRLISGNQLPIEARKRAEKRLSQMNL